MHYANTAIVGHPQLYNFYGWCKRSIYIYIYDLFLFTNINIVVWSTRSASNDGFHLTYIYIYTQEFHGVSVNHPCDHAIIGSTNITTKIWMVDHLLYTLTTSSFIIIQHYIYIYICI